MRIESASWLWDARQACAATSSFVEGSTFEEYSQDLRTRSAVERQLEILGESLNRVRQHDAETAALIPELVRIVGMRNLLAHESGVVAARLVWDAAVNEVPRLRGILDSLLAEQAPPV